MSIEKILQKVIETEKKVSVQIPNDLIQTLLQLPMNNLNHVAYSNYFLIVAAILTKYCCFISENQDLVTRKEIGNFVGLKRDDRMSRIVKRKGLLEEQGFLKYTKDIPLAYLSNIENGNKGFVSLNDYRKIGVNEVLGFEPSKFRNYYVPIPNFLFVKKDSQDGSLNDYSQTYELNYNQLKKIASCNSKGITNYILLFVYCSLRSLSYGRSSLQISAQTISDLKLIGRDSFYRYVKELEKLKLIKVERLFDKDKGTFKTNRYFFI